MEEKNKYAVVLTSDKDVEFVVYMKKRKDNKIAYFDDADKAKQAIEDLGSGEFSLYYMGK